MFRKKNFLLAHKEAQPQISNMLFKLNTTKKPVTSDKSIRHRPKSIRDIVQCAG